MSHYIVDGEKIKFFDGGAKHTHKILKECGNIFQEIESLEGCFYYAYKRKQKNKPLGRASTATPEEQEFNRQRTFQRQRSKIRDLANCNDLKLPKWMTYTYAENEQDFDVFYRDRQAFEKRLERFVRTGKVSDQVVRNFTPLPGFCLEVLGIVDSQDGSRRPDGQGRGALHGHEMNNLPYLPQVSVVAARLEKHGVTQEYYLQNDGTWLKTATPQTYFKTYSYEVTSKVQEWKEKQSVVPGVQSVYARPLCIGQLLWGHGTFKINQIRRMMKDGVMQDVGGYMVSKYMTSKESDDRFQGRKRWYKRGDLVQPKKYRDPWEIEQIKECEGIDDSKIQRICVVDCEYIGWCVLTTWNLALYVIFQPGEFFQKRVEVEIFNARADIKHVLAESRASPLYWGT